MRRVTLQRKDVVTAVRRSNNSSPGPDGIPYAAWRRMGEEGFDVLYAAAQEIVDDDSCWRASRKYPNFNESTLLFLPKKPIDSVDGMDVFEPSGVRPLNVTNTDNRILASATRVAIEPTLNGLITTDQAGFLSG